MTDSWTELSSKTSNTEKEEACSNELTMLDYLLKQIRFAIWKNTFGTLEKYIWKFGQILLVFWTNILKISTNIFSNLNKVIGIAQLAVKWVTSSMLQEA